MGGELINVRYIKTAKTYLDTSELILLRELTYNEKMAYAIVRGLLLRTIEREESNEND